MAKIMRTFGVTIEADPVEGPPLAGLFRTQVPTGWGLVECDCGLRRRGPMDELRLVYMSHAEGNHDPVQRSCDHVG